jgi:hypothetical protein
LAASAINNLTVVGPETRAKLKIQQDAVKSAVDFLKTKITQQICHWEMENFNKPPSFIQD